MKKLITSIILIFFLSGCYEAQSALNPNDLLPSEKPTTIEQQKPIEPIQVLPEINTQNNTQQYTPPEIHYYNNVDGDKVQSPTYYPSEPTGATARCRDGTYSFSRHRSGTCSHHGGVEEWL